MKRHHVTGFIAGLLTATAAVVLLVTEAPVEPRQTCSVVVDGPNCIGPTAWPRSSTTGSVAMFWMEEQPTVNASFSLPADNGVIVQHCNNRFVFTHNDGGTARYFYLQLDSGSGAWTHTTTYPC